jgi:hypothetical protein
VDVGALVGHPCAEVRVTQLVDDPRGFLEAPLGGFKPIEEEVGEREGRQGLAPQDQQVAARSDAAGPVDRLEGSLQRPLRLDGAPGAVVGGRLVPEGARFLEQVDDRCLTSPLRAGVTPRSLA